MTERIMRGPYQLRKHLGLFLADVMPTLLAAARVEWELPDWRLPDPVRYDAYDPMVASEYPTVGSYIKSTNNWRRRDMIEDAEQYSATYGVTLFIWVCTPEDTDNGVRYGDDDYSETLRLRDDMLPILRTALLNDPSLKSNGEVEIREESLSEQYLDAMKVSKEGPLWLAGGTMSFDVKVSESNRTIPVGSFDRLVLSENNTQEMME